MHYAPHKIYQEAYPRTIFLSPNPLSYITMQMNESHFRMTQRVSTYLSFLFLHVKHSVDDQKSTSYRPRCSHVKKWRKFNGCIVVQGKGTNRSNGSMMDLEYGRPNSSDIVLFSPPRGQIPERDDTLQMCYSCFNTSV